MAGASLSYHGNDEFLAMGPDPVSWSDLLTAIEPVLRNQYYAGRTLVSLVACGSSGHTLDRLLSDDRFDPDTPNTDPQAVVAALRKPTPIEVAQ